MRLNLQLFAKSIEELAKEVIQGKYGNGQARKTALGDNYSEVQSLVNSMLGGSYSPTKTTTPPPATTTAAPTTPTSDATNSAKNKVQELESQKPGDFAYDPYQSNWQTQLNDTLNKILNREEFSYDLNGDALYQQYKDQYMAQGKMASMDVMGQAATMTGGYGSSYTETAGHQAYQGYLQQLNDRVPELYQLALSQYNQEGQDLKDQYALYADMDERDYTRYMDDVGMDYNIHRDSVTDWQNELNRADSEYWNLFEHDYRVSRDAIADAETKKKYAYDTAMGMISLGVTPSAEMLADAGISSADASAMAKKVLANEAAAKAASGSGGSEGKGGTYSDVLWNATGTYDDNGNPIFRNSDGKTQAFGAGINPYTGTKHKDAKNGTFSNGYQPNNINGTKLKNSGMSTNITGKNQTIWEANGKHWIWRGDLNKYVEVDISDLD